MADADLHSLDALLIPDEILFGIIRYNSIGLVQQVENINNKINIINNAPAPDVYTRPEMNEQLDTKADKTYIYTKTETDTLLDAKTEKSEHTDLYSKTQDDAQLVLKANVADIVDSYSKTEDDALLTLKANIADIVDSYSKTEDDALLLLKADKTELIDSYSKTETDAKLALKVKITDIVDNHFKIEYDALLLLKTNETHLTNFVDLTSAQMILGIKQFGVISVSSILKQSKNDASILLAGGGDMLVSSLVTQPQLQEVRDIAQGKSKEYVFSTQEEMNDWMAIQDNVAKLVIGDNLYIVDQQVTDYWWDGTQLRELETQLSDLTNVITTLGTATGRGNAITDLSITGNIITPAQNKNFVDLEYDQTITGQKSFTTTIHSVGITYQDYDNSNVILAGSGVRSIADIQSASYTKAQDDALLLLKADKTQLIDSYTKIETNNLLNAKADQSTTYIKSQNDALLLLKADKTQIIDSYTKSQDYALLLLKADKTKLIDSFTKTETNILLNNKANLSTTYNKTETDNLIAQIDIDDVDLSNYYTITKTYKLLSDKANATDLADYVILGTAQTITSNKFF
ncbi:MAG: hypothetical protein EZS28_000636 [Streblomastix strix]|uniref:Uncharacterized protein n=1 Tax=Streblomastix strix TaxID=222440 RepID=A0A5J4X9R9_9EUKA|nr:MAG: hypothetical protein EZS28_000636 [Streblomastix strix]